MTARLNHPGCFVTATGTDAGKTLISLALVAALRRIGQQVRALKPVETGCQPEAKDAERLAQACGAPALAHDPAFYRAVDPLAPAAAARTQGPPTPPLASLAGACLKQRGKDHFLLVEGAGGLLVPYDLTTTMADLGHALNLPILLIAPDVLGTLSHTLCAYEAAQRRHLKVLGVVLNRGANPDESALASGDASNQTLLAERMPVPVLRFPCCASEVPSDLADAAAQCGLLALLQS